MLNYILLRNMRLNISTSILSSTIINLIEVMSLWSSLNKKAVISVSNSKVQHITWNKITSDLFSFWNFWKPNEYCVEASNLIDKMFIEDFWPLEWNCSKWDHRFTPWASDSSCRDLSLSLCCFFLLY